MAISAKDVKRLRDMTGVGMMDCKKALTEAEGDFEKAVELLRKKGQKVAAKRADREANEGQVVSVVADEGRTGVMVEVNCETDFVARNEDFQAFAHKILEIALSKRPADLASLLSAPFDDTRTVEQAVVDMTGKIGEKIGVRRLSVLSSENGKIVSYIHPGARLGVLVEVAGDGDLQTAGTDVAMQVAAMNPLAAFREEVPESVKEQEMEIAREAARNEGKPDHILDRIANGKLERYYKDHVLVEQPFVKDASLTVHQMLKQAQTEVKQFVRFALGD